MKLKLLINLILLSAGFSCKSQPASPTIKIQNSPGFKRNETIKYQILSPPNIYYYVGLEQQLDNKWREIIVDISTGIPDRAAAIKKATAGKPFSTGYQLKKIPAMYLKNGNIFRLKMNYRADAPSVDNTVFSSQFKVE